MSNDPKAQRSRSKIRTQEKAGLEILKQVHKPEFSTQDKDGQNFGSDTASTLTATANIFEYLEELFSVEFLSLTEASKFLICLATAVM